MLFLVDESVNRSVAAVLQKHGYEVRLSIDALGVGASDANIARFAEGIRAIVVDNNPKHFQALIQRRKEHTRYRYAGRVSLKCEPAIASRRVEELLTLIRLEWDYRQTQRDTRVIVEIFDNRITIYH